MGSQGPLQEAGKRKREQQGKPRFYNLFWGAKVTVQMRVLSAPTFFNKKIGICTQILYN